MKKAVNQLLLVMLALSPWLCYLQWGGNHAEFLFSIEYDILFGKGFSADVLAHPIVMIPIIGQVAILVSLLNPNKLKWLTITGQLMITLLMGVILLAGLLHFKFEIIISTLPFIVCSFLFYSKLANR